MSSLIGEEGGREGGWEGGRDREGEQGGGERSNRGRYEVEYTDDSLSTYALREGTCIENTNTLYRFDRYT